VGHGGGDEPHGSGSDDKSPVAGKLAVQQILTVRKGDRQ
jgi:hypothetical protein